MANDFGFVPDDGLGFQADPAGYPNPDAKSNPVSPERSLLDRYFNPQGHGKAGGLIGGALGGMAGGLPGMVIGAGLGNLAGQAPTLSPEQQGLRPPGLAGMAKGSLADARKASAAPAPDDYKPDYFSAVADAATQGLMGLGLKGAGLAAAKFGFPRVAGLLGATTPRAAVLSATPEAVKGISTPALQAVDAATLAGNPAAKEIAAISAEQARRDAVLAMERQLSEKTMAPIQERMAQRVPGLAQKTGDFADALRSVVSPDKLDKAFTDTPSVMEAARDVPTMQARSEMIQQAVPQTVDNQALKLARRPLAAAEARGVSGPPTQAAADAAGLRELGGNMPMDNSYLTRVVNRVPGVGTAMQALPRGGMPPARVAQSTAALLAERGSPTINPLLEPLVSSNPAYRASPSAQATTEILRDLLSRLQGR